jgi:hypothetical protein
MLMATHTTASVFSHMEVAGVSPRRRDYRGGALLTSQIDDERSADLS